MKPDLTKFHSKRRSGEKNPELEELLATGELKIVDLSLVDRDENQPRPIEEVLQDIEKFADELELDNFELAQYPVYSIEPNGRYKIVVGERRTAAFRMKGKEKITAVCKTFTAQEKERISVLQYVENDGDLKKPLSPIADAKWWKHYIDTFHAGNVSAACTARGKTNADISNRLTLLTAPEYIQNAVNKHDIKDPATFAALIRLDKRAGSEVVNGILEDHAQNKLGMSLRTYVENVAANAKTVNVKSAEIKKDTDIVSGKNQNQNEFLNLQDNSNEKGIETELQNNGDVPEEKTQKALPKNSPENKQPVSALENEIVAVIKGLKKAQFSVRLLESSKVDSKTDLIEILKSANSTIEGIINALTEQEDAQ